MTTRLTGKGKKTFAFGNRWTRFPNAMMGMQAVLPSGKRLLTGSFSVLVIGAQTCSPIWANTSNVPSNLDLSTTNRTAQARQQ